MKVNAELKVQAKNSLEGNWGLATGVVVVVWLLTAAFIGDNANHSDGDFASFMSLVSLLLSGPLTFGLKTIYLKFIRRQEASFPNIFEGFTYFIQTFILHILKTIFIVLWLLLLIIPGIIAILRYSMAYYIMVDNPGIGGYEAIRRSKEMMKGHKGRLFYLWLSFLGWFLLGIITFGIGFLYVAPYYEATLAAFYQDLKNHKDDDWDESF
ncbi:hypothetical protein BHU72_04125 [Desulfuribacillus stibiiarsenatis]|uniref:DUF975 domain-containing protein n=1 Tax=Desulfuribacillus stibiiarsenatis TaxID=1390249 RepID=A0A1E5L597_9FIRM|nr:DUF975 family protein [Desulfuribacillus stibiiarsenatis]OEH85290.1 hypothetical protein BHU72_04125 [Desulfuribacillus stibiiarsenatis]